MTFLINEPQARIDLAAAFRWAARWDMHESIANHFSVAVSSDGRKFLLNPQGSHFSRIQASDLLLLDSSSDEQAANAPENRTYFIRNVAISARGRRSAKTLGPRCILHDAKEKSQEPP